jgi:ankyrin repeat protein
VINKLSLSLILTVLLNFMNPVYASGHEDLIKAAGVGNILKVKELVEQRANINEKDSQGNSALCFAATRSHREVVTFLLSQGAEVDNPASNGLTPLMAASRNGWEDIVEMMISKGAKVNAEATNGMTPLIHAASGGNANVVRLLIRHGADLALSGYSALIAAINAENKNIVELLILNGVNINPSEGDSYSQHVRRVTKKGVVSSNASSTNVVSAAMPAISPKKTGTPVSPLRLALMKKQEEIALLLMNNGAVIEKGNSDNENTADPALVLALEGSMFKAAKALIERGADVNGIKYGYPLVSYFMAYSVRPEGILDTVKFLCDHGADVERRPVRSGSAPLMIAASRGRQDIVELLLSRGANINVRYSDPKGYHSGDLGDTSLAFAARAGYTSIVDLLLSKGADINSKKWNGSTALIDALRGGHREVALILIAHNADVNAETSDGNTPLKSALTKKDLQIAQILVDKGADVNAKSMKGYAHSLISRGDFETAQFIVKNGLNMNDSYEGTTPLYYAAQRGLDAYVELFITHKANVNIKNQLGRTPLMAASENGHMATLKLLLANDADRHAVDSSGLNAFVLATQKGHVDIAAYLESKGVDTTDYSNQLKLISVMKEKGFIPPSAKPDELTPQYLEYVKLMLKEMGIEDVWKWEPDPRYSSPESTWEHYRQALMDGDFDMAQKCHVPGVKQVDAYKQLGKEKTSKMASSMPPLERISGDSKRATYQLERSENGHDISYGVSFTNVFGEWKIEQY